MPAKTAGAKSTAAEKIVATKVSAVSKAPAKTTTKDIREWAIGEGREVSPRGRISAEIEQAFHDAQATKAQAKAVPVKQAAAKTAAKTAAKKAAGEEGREEVSGEDGWGEVDGRGEGCREGDSGEGSGGGHGSGGEDGQGDSRVGDRGEP
ncbi:histone-like nucleoid-structuring protein Lsr2 [Rhodococcus sp. NPDC127530]|uniref:Lsr2 family DNA-binding protein n=1 Tax=Rhodococcus sp. NPDC127530 TaxID=3345397 RepID=UPI0036282238